MKTALLLLCFSLLTPYQAAAWSLKWDRGQGGGDPDGYTVWISTDGGATYPYNYTVAATELALDGICQYGEVYTFRVTAFNSAGESQPTDRLDWPRPAYQPPPDNPLPAVSGLPYNASGLKVE